jgi:hypothetical protein
MTTVGELTVRLERLAALPDDTLIPSAVIEELVREFISISSDPSASFIERRVATRMLDGLVEILREARAE